MLADVGFVFSNGKGAGKLVKNLNHMAVSFSRPKKNVIGIEIHHGSRKNVASLRTVRTIINNLIIGVTKGFKYKMRYVYAHFPINVNFEQNKETGLWEVEIRWVFTPFSYPTFAPVIFFRHGLCDAEEEAAADSGSWHAACKGKPKILELRSNHGGILVFLLTLVEPQKLHWREDRPKSLYASRCRCRGLQGAKG